MIRQLNASPAVVAGHSMGAFVALAAARDHAVDVDDVVLVDGGAPIGVPPSGDSQAALDELLGPAIARLERVWPDRVSYRSMWDEHPAFTGHLTPEIERYVLSDLVECDGGFRSCVAVDAVRHDGAEVLVDPDVRNLLEHHRSPARIVRAPAGIDGSPPPLIDRDTVAAYGRHHWRTVTDTNHYSILIGEVGAAAVAEEILAAARPTTA